jgi:hypothetical protein
MKWLRNLFIPDKAFKVVMYRDNDPDEVRIFLDKDTMNRLIVIMRSGGYEIRGFVESIKILVNNKGN